MLRSIRLRNFKSFRDTGDVPLRPLTLIVGQNNVGKSAILHAILMLKQTLQDKNIGSTLITAGPFVDLGSFQHIVRGGKGARNKIVSIDLAAPSSFIRPLLSRSSRKRQEGPGGPVGDLRLSVGFSYDSRTNKVLVSSVRLSRGQTDLIEVRRFGKGWSLVGVSRPLREHVTVARFDHFLPMLIPVRHEAGRSRNQKGMDQFSEAFELRHAWSRVFESVRHVAPLRLPIPFVGIRGRVATSDIGAGGENLLRILGDTERVRGAHRSLVESVNYWMSERFGMLRGLRLEEVDSAGLVRSLVGDEREGFNDINIAAMGEGLSQLLPIVASVLRTTRGDSLLIEQPEIHLHPAAQADFGDLLIESLGKRRDRQFIVETHSEHLLLRIRRRIAEGTISPNSVSILYVERVRRESRVRTLKLTKKGYFDDWPKGFFEEGYNETLELAKAASSAGSGP